MKESFQISVYEFNGDRSSWILSNFVTDLTRIMKTKIFGKVFILHYYYFVIIIFFIGICTIYAVFLSNISKFLGEKMADLQAVISALEEWRIPELLYLHQRLPNFFFS